MRVSKKSFKTLDIFDYKNENVLPGVQRLIETPMTINGITPDPDFIFLGGQASASGWTSYKYPKNPVTLALQAGTVPSYNQGSPLLGTLDDSVKGNSGGYFLAPDTVLGDITTSDFCLEVILKVNATSEWIIDKRNGPGVGWLLYKTGVDNVQLYLTSGATIKAHDAAIKLNSLMHMLFFGNRDEDSINGLVSYSNSIANTGTNISTLGSLTVAQALAIGAKSIDGSAPFSGNLYYAALYQYASWFQAGAAGPNEWATVAKSRFLKLTGGIPLHSWGTPTPTAYGTTSYAYQQKLENDGTSRIYQVGASFPRFEKRVDANGRTFTGILNEAARTNLLLQSETFNDASWTKFNCSISATSVLVPNGNWLTTSAINEGVVNDYHIMYQVHVLTNGLRHVVSANFKIANRTKCLLYSDANPIAYIYYDLVNDVFSVPMNCNFGRKLLGNGWINVWISFIATASALCNVQISPTISILGGSANFQGLNQDSLYLFGVLSEIGDYPSSYIPTTTASVTRNADSYILPAQNNIGLSEGGVRFKFLAPVISHTLSNRRTLWSAYTDSSNYIEIYLHTDGTLNCESKKSGASNGAVSLAGSKLDNITHEVLCTWRQGQLDLYCDGTQGTSDTDVGIITSATSIGIGQDNASTNNAGPVLISEVKCYKNYQESWYK